MEAESGLHLVHLNLDEIHAKAINPVYANDYDLGDSDSMYELNRQLYTSHEGDHLDTIPKCRCKVNPIQGWANEGIICNTCKQPVNSFSNAINEQLWLRATERMDVLINPIWWSKLSAIFTTRRNQNQINYLRWFCDPKYRIPEACRDDQYKLMSLLQSMGIERGWKPFTQNIVRICEGLVEAGMTKNGVRPNVGSPVDQLIRYADTVFTKYLPIPSAGILVKESTSNNNSYIDPTIVGVIDGVRAICELSQDSELYSDKQFDSRLVQAQENIANGYSTFDYANILKKPSLIRAGLISGRMDPSARAVITSISRPHDYREVELPWPVALSIWKNELVEMFMRDGWLPTESLEYIRRHIHQYDEKIDKYLDEFIAAGEVLPLSYLRTGKTLVGRPIILHRNPGLKIGSQQKLYITVVKSNTMDFTISLSNLILSDPNAD